MRHYFINFKRFQATFIHFISYHWMPHSCKNMYPLWHAACLILRTLLSLIFVTLSNMTSAAPSFPFFPFWKQNQYHRERRSWKLYKHFPVRIYKSIFYIWISKVIFQDVQKFHRRFTRQSIATRTSDFDKILKIIQEKETGLSKIEINFRNDENIRFYNW